MPDKYGKQKSIGYLLNFLTYRPSRDNLSLNFSNLSIFNSLTLSHFFFVCWATKPNLQNMAVELLQKNGHIVKGYAAFFKALN